MGTTISKREERVDHKSLSLEQEFKALSPSLTRSQSSNIQQGEKNFGTPLKEAMITLYSRSWCIDEHHMAMIPH